MAEKNGTKIKVLIGVITYDSDWYCLKAFAQSTSNLDCSNLNVDIFIVDNSDTDNYFRNLKKFFPTAKIKRYLPPKELKGFARFRHCEEHCRRMVRGRFLSDDYTHLFFIDSDVICPSDALKKLLARDTNIICAKFNYRDPPKGRTLWFIKKKPVKISHKTGVWMIDFISNERLEWHKNNTGSDLISIDACGFGAILIKKEVLQKIKFRKSQNDHYGVDINFCFDAKKIGYKIYGDPSVFCDHRYRQCARRRDSNAHAF